MSFPHKWSRLYQENWREHRIEYAAACRECGVWFTFNVDKIDMRDMPDIRMPQWRLENEEIFLELNLPCIYPEPNA